MLDKDSVKIRVSSVPEASEFETRLIRAGERTAKDYWPFQEWLVYTGGFWFLSDYDWPGLDEITFDQLISEL